MKWTTVSTKALSIVGGDSKQVMRLTEAPTPVNYREHALGQLILNVVPGDGRGHSQWACFDYDGNGVNMDKVKRLLSPLEGYAGLIIEPGNSRGWHVYLLVSKEVPAKYFLPMKSWMEYHLDCPLEMFPCFTKTISLPKHGDEAFWEDQTELDAELVSLAEVYAELRMLPRNKQLLKTPLPITEFRDNTCYELNSNSGIYLGDLRMETWKWLNQRYVSPEFEFTDFNRLFRAYAEWLEPSATEDGKVSNQAATIYECVKQVAVIDDISGDVQYRLTVTNPVTGMDKEVLCPALTILSESALFKHLFKAMGYKFQVTADKFKHEEKVNEWMASEREHLPFHVTKAGMLLNKILEHVRLNPLSPEAQARAEDGPRMFYREKEERVYVSFAALTGFMAPGRNQVIAPIHLPQCLSVLKAKNFCERVELDNRDWLAVNLATAALRVKHVNRLGQQFVEAVSWLRES